MVALKDRKVRAGVNNLDPPRRRREFMVQDRVLYQSCSAAATG